MILALLSSFLLDELCGDTSFLEPLRELVAGCFQSVVRVVRRQPRTREVVFYQMCSEEAFKGHHRVYLIGYPATLTIEETISMGDGYILPRLSWPLPLDDLVRDGVPRPDEKAFCVKDDGVPFGRCCCVLITSPLWQILSKVELHERYRTMPPSENACQISGIGIAR